MTKDNNSISLSPKETKVLDLIRNGNTSKQIAINLNISANTVGNHRANIVKKLNLKGTNALNIYTLRNQI